MPTYEYACPTCGIVEVFQSIKEDALKKCPQCKKAKVQRMVSVGAGVIFKGSGFWETDYNRSSDYQKKSKEDKDGGSGADPVPQPKTKTETKTDSKSNTSPGTSTTSAPSTPAPAAPTKPPSKA